MKLDAMTTYLADKHRALSVLCVPLLLMAFRWTDGRAPMDDPLARYQLAWTHEVPWANVVNIAEVCGDTLEARFEAAQQTLTAAKGASSTSQPEPTAFRATCACVTAW